MIYLHISKIFYLQDYSVSHEGPILDTENNVVVGLPSFARGCAHPGYPGVAARVSSQVREKMNNC